MIFVRKSLFHHDEVMTMYSCKNSQAVVLDDANVFFLYHSHNQLIHV